MCLIIEFPFLTHVHLSCIIPVVLGKPPEDHVSRHKCFLNTHGWARCSPADLPRHTRLILITTVSLIAYWSFSQSLRIVSSLKDGNSGLFVSLCSIHVLWMTYNLWVLPYMLPDGLTPSALSRLSLYPIWLICFHPWIEIFSFSSVSHLGLEYCS